MIPPYQGGRLVGVFEYPAEVKLFRSRANQPVVGLDIDGTLGDYHRHFLEFAEKWLGREMPHPEAINPGFRLSTFIGVSHREYRECKLAYRQGGLKRWMPVYPYASELTHNIREYGAQVWICTSRPYLRMDNIDPDTREWLRRNKIEYDAVIWESLDDEISKYQDLVSQVGADRIVAVVDDLSEQVTDARAQGIAQVYIREQPYNRDMDLPGIRFTSLEDLWEDLAVDIELWKERHGI